jgi:hypothetical protein
VEAQDRRGAEDRDRAGRRQADRGSPNQLWELYDLAADPGETSNRWDDDPTTAGALRELLLDYWQRVRAARALGLPKGSF